MTLRTLPVPSRWEVGNGRAGAKTHSRKSAEVTLISCFLVWIIQNIQMSFHSLSPVPSEHPAPTATPPYRTVPIGLLSSCSNACCGLCLPPPNSHVEVLTLVVMVFADGAFGR